MPPLGYATLVFALLLLGGMTLVGGRFVPIRLLQAIRAPDPASRDHRRALLLACSGIGAIGGAGLAVGAAGPGALPWMWVAAILGAGIVHAEVSLSARFRHRDASGRWSFGLAEVLLAQGDRLTTFLAFAVALTAALAALVFGGAFQSTQLASTFGELTEGHPFAVGVLLAGLIAPFLLGPARMRAALRARLLAAAPALVGLYVGFVCVLLLSSPGLGGALERMFIDAARIDAAAAGGLGGAFGIAAQQGLVRGIMATQVGLGTAGSLEEVPRVREPDRAGGAVMAIPLLVALLVSTSTGLLIAASGTRPLELVDARRGEVAEMVYLERAEGVGLEPNLDLGQLVVLADDSPLQVGQRYPMRMRADPRGHLISAVVILDENAVGLSDRPPYPAAHWSITRDVKAVVFRDRDEERARNPAFDVRVPVRRVEETDDEGRRLVLLRPIDDRVNLEDLARRMRGPYVVVQDYRFDAGVGEISDGRRAIYLERDPEWPLDPVLRQVTVEMGMRGPFLDRPDDDTAPPWGFIAREDLDEPIGRVLHLRLRSPARGLAPAQIGGLVAVRPEELGDELEANERDLRSIGELRTPAWDFLAGAQHVVLRHDEDPSQDLRVRVRVRRGDDGSLRFRSADPSTVDFAQVMVAGMKGYTGPYLMAPDYELDVVVRTGARLPAALRDRRVLVPLGVPPSPVGPPPGGELYRPHPHELLLSGMEGPFLVREGATLVGVTFDAASGDGSGWVGSLLLTLLAVASMAIMGLAGGRHLGRVMGPGAEWGFRLAFLIAVAVLPSVVEASALLGLVDMSLLLAIAFETAALVFLGRQLGELGGAP